MSFFAAKGQVRPTALQRKKLRMEAGGGEEGTGWYRRSKDLYKDYTPPKPQDSDPIYERDVRLRAVKERAADLAGDETGGWADAWNYHNDSEQTLAANAANNNNQGAAEEPANVDPWAAKKAPKKKTRAPVEEEPEEEQPTEMLQPANEFTLDQEETAETRRRMMQSKMRETRGNNRMSTSSFATPYDQRYGGRPDVMNGTIKCDFVHQRLPKSPSAAYSPNRFRDSMH